MVNKAIIVGRVGADPEVRRTGSDTAVANLSIATNKRWTDNSGEKQERTEWHRVVFWERNAEIAEQYVKKGDLIFVEGEIQTRQWEDNEGNTKYTTEIKGYRMQMLGSAGSSGDGAPPSSKEPVAAGGGDFETDDDLPF